MKLKINDLDVELVYSFRSGMYFEQITGHPLDLSNMNSSDVATLFYCVVVASLQKMKQPIISMMDFMDVIDDCGGDKCVLDFANWYANILKNQYEFLDSIEGKEPAKKKKTTKKS